MSFLTFLLSGGVEQKIAPYIEECRRTQGVVGYKTTPFMKGYGFTYSKEFLESTKQMYLILSYETDDLVDSISEIFIVNNIKSCKGLVMTKTRTKHLINKLILPSLAR